MQQTRLCYYRRSGLSKALGFLTMGAIRGMSVLDVSLEGVIYMNEDQSKRGREILDQYTPKTKGYLELITQGLIEINN